MKLTVNQEQFVKPLQLVNSVIERRQTLAVLSNVLVNAKNGQCTLTGTDMEVEIVASLETQTELEGEITIPAKKLLDICKSLPADQTVSVELNDGKVVVKSGRARFTLSSLPANDFPSLDEIEVKHAIKIAQKDLRYVIDKTQFAMAQQDVRYYLNGLLFDFSGAKLRAVATDGHRLALSEVDLSEGLTENQQLIVPRKGVQELMRVLEDTDEEALLEISGNHLRIQANGVRFTTKLIDGRFPDYRRVVPEQGDLVVIADRETLKQTLSRAAILSNEKFRGVRLEAKDNVLKIQAHNPEQEEAVDEMEVGYAGRPLEVGFNVNYLIDAITVVNTENIQLNFMDASSSCLISGVGAEDCKYVVMPMRL